MLKIIFKIFILCLFFSNNVLAEIINKIEISGNKRISKATILVLGKISEGENFDNNKLNNSLKNLYETNFFSDIKLSLSDGLLTINLVENPIIENIEKNLL